MKAMILAAGLGTRLRPLSDDRPKALVEVAGRTMLEIALARLRAAGVREVIVNLHHFAGMILEYLKAHDNFGLRIEVSREPVLLDTGGGLKQAAWFFLEDSNRLEEPFIVHNVDVISTIDLRRSTGRLPDTCSSTSSFSSAAGNPGTTKSLKWFDLHHSRRRNHSRRRRRGRFAASTLSLLACLP
jgi:hypothetical protein